MDVPIASGQFDSHSIQQYNPVMSYLIDGHNLIPKIQGLSLQAMDDEERLISMLQEFCRATRKSVDVYFDNAPAGQAGQRNFGMVHAHFVRQGSTADQAIETRLSRLGKQARNWTVVSSDRRVQAAARAAHAKVVSADAFSSLMLQSRQVRSSTGDEPDLSEGEIEEWLRIFKKDNPSRR